MTTSGGRLLIVEDDAAIREALAERFRARGFDVREADSGREAQSCIAAGVDAVLLDLQLPDGDGFAVLESLQGEEDAPGVIVLTAHGSVERAVRAMRLGAYDFLEKPFEPARVEEAVGRAMERGTLRRARAALELDQAPMLAEGREPMAGTLALARRVAASDATVLIEGESGTGKEVIAREIHRRSQRAAGPFVAVHCAALTETLVESELFGHERGAFTGADARRIGRFEAAHQGTLLLDEVGELPPSTQVKLLRVLQERTFERVGGGTPVRVDLRLLAATNRDLATEVREGRFREDLYYRLKVIQLTMPPLRERGDDVLELAQHFLRSFAGRSGSAALSFAPEAEEALRSHRWPGNVRELRNAIERAGVLAEGEMVVLEDLPPEVLLSSAPHGASAPEDAGFHAQVEAFRARVLREALRAAGGNRTEAAKTLGLQRTYLARLIKRHGLADD